MLVLKPSSAAQSTWEPIKRKGSRDPHPEALIRSIRRRSREPPFLDKLLRQLLKQVTGPGTWLWMTKPR